jgi:hypothetical protein
MIAWHSASACAFGVNILERQHFTQPGFSTLRKAAALDEGFRIFVRAEQTIPDGQVAIVELVNVKLVMNGMELGSLNEIAKPRGRLDIGVIEILARTGEEVVLKGSQQ